MSHSRKDELPADVITGQKYSNGTSASDEYYRFKLLQGKLDAAALNSEFERSGVNVAKIKSALSERELIEIQILNKLIDITESSPEFDQLTSITGSRDRYEMSRILAETVYDKQRAEQILQFYTPSKEAMKSHFANRTLQSFAVRAGPLASLAQVGSESVATTLGRAFGIATSPPAGAANN